jgi:hypothetical protein
VKDLVDIKKVAKQLEEAYQLEKNKECEELHNAIADVLSEKKATPQNTLFVIEMVKFEILRATYEQLMGHVIVPPGGGVKRDVKLSTGEAK